MVKRHYAKCVGQQEQIGEDSPITTDDANITRKVQIWVELIVGNSRKQLAQANTSQSHEVTTVMKGA